VKTDFRFCIIVSRWNGLVTQALLDGALETLKRHGVPEDHIEVVKIPGCFEMGLAAKQMARRNCFNALICLGAVIRGETTHHQVVAAEAARAIAEVSREFNIPIGFGILTTDTTEQAIARAGGKAGNKGSEAALAAIEMAALLETFKKEI